MKEHYDCIVIGGGPAGSTAAAIVAEAGFSTLLVEREKFPRFHVGESLMPECYWPLKRLGVLDQMKSSQFVRKLSVQFVSHSGHESQPFFFKQHDAHECSTTWQVERAEFDKLLFDNAAKKGAECHNQTCVLSVRMDGSRATGVQLQTENGSPRTIGARVVIDASGQQALMANSLNLKVSDPLLRKAAVWGYYRGARRDPGENGGATIILRTRDRNSWFWYIPLSNDITSIGVVGDNEYLRKGRGSPSAIFEDELVKCPALVERLMQAELVSEFRVAKEFSYFTRQQAGDGWVLVGDALAFIDPIYSSGVYLALQSGQLAADAVVAGLQKNDTSQVQLGSWLAGFLGGTKWIKKLVAAFYAQEFSFSEFLRDHPEHRANLIDLLIGRVFYDGAGRIFDDLTPAIEQAMAKREQRRSNEGRGPSAEC